MSWGYFDSSVLLKQYVVETGTPPARILFSRYDLVSCAIAPLEITSALARRRAAGELEARHFLRAVAWIRDDREHWRLIELSPSVLARAADVIRETALRTLDAIHIASCLVFAGGLGTRVPFITADARQREAAARVHLDVVWVA